MSRIVRKFESIQLDALAGAAFGVGLLLFSFRAIGMGHGPTTLTGLASAPLGLFGFGWATTLGVPVLWYAIGAALSYSRTHAGGKLPFLALMLLHYSGIPLVFLTAHEFDDFSTLFRRAPEIGGIACAYYGLAQIAIWYRFATSQRTHSAAAETNTVPS